MNERTLARLDVLSRVILWLWVALVLGTFLAGRLEGLRRVLDYGAWVAFGVTFLFSFLSRWLNEIVDADAVGPVRVWMAAALVALMMCLASTFILFPKIGNIQARLAAAQAEGRDTTRDQASLRKARSVNTQMLVFRLLLALGLGWGAMKLPRKKTDRE